MRKKNKILFSLTMASSSQKDFIMCGEEFGLENVGKVALVHRESYDGKKAGSDFRNHLRSCTRHLDFTSMHPSAIYPHAVLVIELVCVSLEC